MTGSKRGQNNPSKATGGAQAAAKNTVQQDVTKQGQGDEDSRGRQQGTSQSNPASRDSSMSSSVFKVPSDCEDPQASDKQFGPWSKTSKPRDPGPLKQSDSTSTDTSSEGPRSLSHVRQGRDRNTSKALETHKVATRHSQWSAYKKDLQQELEDFHENNRYKVWKDRQDGKLLGKELDGARLKLALEVESVKFEAVKTREAIVRYRDAVVKAREWLSKEALKDLAAAQKQGVDADTLIKAQTGAEACIEAVEHFQIEAEKAASLYVEAREEWGAAETIYKEMASKDIETARKKMEELQEERKRLRGSVQASVCDTSVTPSDRSVSADSAQQETSKVGEKPAPRTSPRNTQSAGGSSNRQQSQTRKAQGAPAQSNAPTSTGTVSKSKKKDGPSNKPETQAQQKNAAGKANRKGTNT